MSQVGVGSEKSVGWWRVGSVPPKAESVRQVNVYVKRFTNA